MLTVAIVFLFAAIVTAVFGLIAAGPIGLAAAAVFFAVFVWSLASHRRSRRRRVLDENPLRGTTRAGRD